MEIATIIWLVLFGALIISTFSLGTYYLSEWKDGLITEAKYSADAHPSTYASNIAEAKVRAKISLPIWAISFLLTFGSVIGVIVVLLSLL